MKIDSYVLLWQFSLNQIKYALNILSLSYVQFYLLISPVLVLTATCCICPATYKPRSDKVLTMCLLNR